MSGSRLLRVAVIGTGFVGPHHVDAVRRGGYGEVVALGGADRAQLEACGRNLGIDRATLDVPGILADPAIDVVHICTPNVTHVPLATAALEAGKHVVVEKPLALDSGSARSLAELASSRRRHAMVSFTYRGYPMVRRARALVADGELGDLRLVHGQYLQDWLALDSDYDWRVDPRTGGASRAVADIGTHWFDTIEFITGRRIEAVLANFATFVARRRRPDDAPGSAAGFLGDGTARAASEDAATLLVRLAGGAIGECVVSQVSHGHKNDFAVELTGSLRSIAWRQETPETLWFASRDTTQILVRHPADGGLRGTPGLPAGHPEGWGEALRDLLQPFYAAIVNGEEPSDQLDRGAYPTLEAGVRAVDFVEAALRSAAEDRWVEIASTSPAGARPSADGVETDRATEPEAAFSRGRVARERQGAAGTRLDRS